MMGGMGGMSSADFLEQMFGNADADGDEQISMEEMITAISNAPAGGPTAEEIFDKLDTNKDGYVSKAEFDAGHAQERGPFRQVTQRRSFSRRFWKFSRTRIVQHHQAQMMHRRTTVPLQISLHH